jgi:hypothetical protein
MPSKFRLVSVFLVAMLMVVAGCSMLVRKASANGAQNNVNGDSRQDSGATLNLGSMTVAGFQKNLPNAWALVGSGSWSLAYTPAPGYYFVKWQVVGPIVIADPNAQSTTFTLTGDGTITAIYSNRPPSVGGVAVPTNTFMILAPYLAMIGLIATAAIAIKKRRN